MRLNKCPKCKCEYSTHPAISRVDDKTEICGICGNIEALAKMVEPNIKLSTKTLTTLEKKIRKDILKDILNECG